MALQELTDYCNCISDRIPTLCHHGLLTHTRKNNGKI